MASIGLTGVAVASAPTPIGAENPSEVIPELADDGVYVAPGRADEADAASFAPVIEAARVDGVSMAVVWPDDPQPNTNAFARRMQEASMLDVVLVFGPDDVLGSFVSEDYEDGSIRATAAAREVSTPTQQASAFLVGLLEEPVRERPAIIDDVVRWIAICLAALVAAAVGEQMIRGFKRSQKRRKLRQQTESISSS